MPSPLFEFFEVVAEELCVDSNRVLTREDLQVGHDEAPLLLDELKVEMGAATTENAIELAVKALGDHFAGKGSNLPFSYDAATGRFIAVDPEFLAFINDMSSIRSMGKRSRDFECRIAQRLRYRAMGSVHRVGFPRDVKKKAVEFNGYLKALGFSRPAALGKDKDGGLDVLWLMPIGTIPHRPIVSVQCKNGEYDIDEADKSYGAGTRSFSQHGGLQPTVHVPCVFFNDYIHPSILSQKQFNLVILGLTDLAAMKQPVFTVEMI